LTEAGALGRPPVTFGCNECNETLDAARAALRAARRLTLVAENALANGDLWRARTALRNVYDATAGGSAPDALTAPNAAR
jgi:hypothetical protein